MILGGWVAAIGGKMEPLQGFSEILIVILGAVLALIEPAKFILGLGMALLCSPVKPYLGLGTIYRESFARAIQVAKHILRLGVALSRHLKQLPGSQAKPIPGRVSFRVGRGSVDPLPKQIGEMKLGLWMISVSGDIVEAGGQSTVLLRAKAFLIDQAKLVLGIRLCVGDSLKLANGCCVVPSLQRL